ncbi:MAG: 2-amino-5-formylamino-6-ribosylaminopyrimidin-4(3H)-one 5'-monophosphate deformylase [Methanobrevibacter sp.]|jgi:2-amino-5-formylamino-6-ribosylaminopyrimidin-4(3H)-one 5'-monophosphate deformylase|nr:2-amino-5-formylamino-6-ribosylaminopyrimidin-4(3H)-one 5'-monophosphate deformylase [Candidatus Methanoflexus mossambicus]
MIELRYNAGNIKDPNVHKIGVIALGSHLENHGPALPIDTDAKIASKIALEASLKSGAKFLGVIYPAYEIDEINHGIHNSLNELIKNIINILKQAQKFLFIEKVVIVNAHGGNLDLALHLDKIENETNLLIQLNNKIIEIEGPHGGSGELSMGKVLGIVNEEETKNQGNVKLYGEIGLFEFDKARINDPNIEKGAKEIEIEGVYIDEKYGEELLSIGVNSVLLDIEKFLDIN